MNKVITKSIRQMTLEEYIQKNINVCGDINGELWRVRKVDGRLYRILVTEYLSADVTIHVSHDLDTVPLLDIYAMRGKLLVNVKDNGSCVVYRDTWENVPLNGRDIEVTSEIIQKFAPSREDTEKLQNYISSGLYYFAHGLIYNFFIDSDINHYSLLLEYKKYLGLDGVSETKILSLGDLECTERTYRIAIGTIYGTWEMRYFFYVLYLVSKQGTLKLEDIISKGKYLGYSEDVVIDYIKQMKVVMESSDASLWDSSIRAFKYGVAEPNKRVLPESVATFAYSVEGFYTEEDKSSCSEDADWSGYETMDYWDIEDDCMRDAFDDDAGAYLAYLD